MTQENFDAVFHKVGQSVITFVFEFFCKEFTGNTTSCTTRN